jgi:YfiH family protein
MPVKVIRPAIFKDQKWINAFVTLKNRDLFGDERNIPGLNLGYHTQENPEVITQNRQALIHAFDMDEEWMAFANQVHGNRVKVVSHSGTFSETDGLITQIPGLTLAIQIADCAAVLIADPSSKIIGAVHAGWRGAAGYIIANAAEKMAQFGAKMEDCKAFISPCISVEEFEVGREVAEQFPPSFVDFRHYEKPHINLKNYLHHQLRQAGVRDENIDIHPGCTVQDDQYYSYRREKELSGRMMAIIQMRKGQAQ